MRVRRGQMGLFLENYVGDGDNLQCGLARRGLARGVTGGWRRAMGMLHQLGVIPSMG